MKEDNFISDTNSERLDVFLHNKIDLSRSQIKKLINKEYITVNNQKQKAGYILSFGDEIKIKYLDEITLIPQNVDFKILFEDNDIAIISKPQGLVVHPGAGNFDKTLVNGLLYKFDNLSHLGDDFRPGIVHRLDKDTSGLMVIAKTDESFSSLVQMFKDKQIEKTYIAIAEGKIEEDGIIDSPIGRDVNDRIKFAVTEVNSKKAITHYEPIKVFERHTFLKIKILTGRTHQIRVHMKYISHPILGDPLYGRKNKYGIQKQMLHAIKLSFKHPITGVKMTFEDEIPERFVKFMKRQDI